MDDLDLKRCVLLSERRLIRSIPQEENLSHRFSPGFLRAMRRLIKQAEHPSAAKAAIRFRRRTVMILVAALIAALSLTLSVSAWREALFQFLEQRFPQYLRVSFVSDGAEQTGQEFIAYAPGWLPNGFTVLDTICNGNEVQVWSHGQDLKYLRYRQLRVKDAALLVNPGVKPDLMEIHGWEAHLYELPNERVLVWEDDEYAYFISSNLDRAALKQVAENLKAIPGMFVSLSPAYLPEGMKLVDSNYGNRIRLDFQDEGGRNLLYQQLWLADSKQLYFSQAMDWKAVDFDGHAAREAVSGDYVTLAWGDGDYYYSVASNAGREEVWRVAKSLEPNQREQVLREPSWLPDGFQETDRQEQDAREIFYESSDGQRLTYRQDSIDSVSVNLDSIEEVKEFNLKGHAGYYYTFADENVLLWYDEQNVYQLSAALDEETLGRIARSVQ